MANDDIFFVNSDGEYIFDIAEKKIVYENTAINHPWKNLSENNLMFNVVNRDEHVNFFGLRGGDGNQLTRDNKWKIEIINLSWNVKIPRLTNCKTGISYYLELKQNLYEGYKFAGFSTSQNYFLIMGDCGIDIYERK